MAITYNNLFSQIYDFENLYNAYLKARRGKRDRREVLKFELNLEENPDSISRTNWSGNVQDRWVSNI